MRSMAAVTFSMIRCSAIRMSVEVVGMVGETFPVSTVGSLLSGPVENLDGAQADTTPYAAVPSGSVLFHRPLAHGLGRDAINNLVTWAISGRERPFLNYGARIQHGNELFRAPQHYASCCIQSLFPIPVFP